MSRKSTSRTLSEINGIAVADREPTTLTKDQLLSQLDDISESAGALVRKYFAQRKSTRTLKSYVVAPGFENMPPKTPENAKHVFEVLKAAGRALTIEEWADELRPQFTKKSQNMQNVIRANKPLLDTIGAIVEAEVEG